jgi:hypothetical protein
MSIDIILDGKPPSSHLYAAKQTSVQEIVYESLPLSTPHYTPFSASAGIAGGACLLD